MDRAAAPATVPVAEFIAAMGQNVSPVCVITAAHEGRRSGLTATAVSSLCADPPRLLACVNRNGASHAMIAAAGRFCINVLAEEQDHIARVFAGMAGRDVDRFSAGEWHTLSTGAPALAGATAVFDCELAMAVEQFSHSIFIGHVLAVRTSQNRDPLLYGARRFRTLRKAMAMPEQAVLEGLHF
jgi:flavin reductase (DIM6/NTAB) family NADH-FMN oxidoreductase RutF